MMGGGLRIGESGESGGGEVLGRPEQWVLSEQGPEGCRVSSVLSLSSQQLSRGWVLQGHVPAQALPAQTLDSLGPTSEASRAAVTLICTTDPLAIGTASPAPSAIAAAGLVIVAKVPGPTFHVPHTHVRATGQAGSKVGRVCLLLTGSGLHVAGVPSRTAVLAVLTAHGVRQLAAGPAPTQAWAAGLPHWAAGVLVTAHVSAVRQGSPAGRHLLQSSHHLVPPLTLPPSQARVAMGAAVLVV